jgi:phosphatidylglycerophosphate synthase
MSRLPLAGMVWLSPEKPKFILGITLVAGVTDLLDGWVARRTAGGPTPMGAWLDPVCDKVFVLSALGAAAVQRKPPVVIPLMIALREILQLPLAAYYLIWATRHPSARPINWKAGAVGKITTGLQFLAIGGMLLRSRWTFLLAAQAGVAGSIAASYYFFRTLRELKQSTPAPRRIDQAAA